MTQPLNRSRGHAHSLKIKQSGGWARYQAERHGMTLTEWSHEENRIALNKAELALKKRKKPEPSPKAYLSAIGFDLTGIRAQLAGMFRAGYVRALRDVKREKQRQERASYVDALYRQRITKQELARMSHAYDLPR